MARPSAAASYAGSAALHERALQLIPGAHHLSARPLGEVDSSPLYFERGEGCRITDVDGHTYIDLFMGFGPYLLGYADPVVDEAARRQGERGRVLSMSHPLHVAFVEAMLDRFGGEQGIFLRTGSEATTAALRIARRATGRRRVVRCGYHGWHDWCLPLEEFVPGGLDEQVLEMMPPTPAALQACFDRYPGEIAAVILAPEMILPFAEETFFAMQALARAHGAVFVMDEVKTGLRIAPGSVSARIGLVPDILALSKALGNGWATAVLLGRREVMQHAAGMHLSGTFHGDTSAMAASLATVKRADETRAAEHAWAMGERLIEGLSAIGDAHDVPCEAFGEPLPPMPFFRFTHPDAARNRALTASFYEETRRRGVLLHPRHMWFTSLAHSPGDIEHVLSVADEAMALTKRA